MKCTSVRQGSLPIPRGFVSLPWIIDITEPGFKPFSVTGQGAVISGGGAVRMQVRVLLPILIIIIIINRFG